MLTISLVLLTVVLFVVNIKIHHTLPARAQAFLIENKIVSLIINVLISTSIVTIIGAGMVTGLANLLSSIFFLGYLHIAKKPVVTGPTVVEMVTNYIKSKVFFWKKA